MTIRAVQFRRQATGTHAQRNDFVRLKPRATSRSGFILDAVKHRIVQPIGNRRFAPSHAASGDADLRGKGPLVDLAIQGGAAEAGAVEHGIEAENAVGGIGGHGMILVRV